MEVGTEGKISKKLEFSSRINSETYFSAKENAHSIILRYEIFVLQSFQP